MKDLYLHLVSTLDLEMKNRNDNGWLIDMMMSQPKLDQAQRLISTVNAFFSEILNNAKEIVSELNGLSVKLYKEQKKVSEVNVVNSYLFTNYFDFGKKTF
jgi:hypothetical protein